MMHHCPRCNSTNVWVGAYVLSCNDCGWNHNNDRPCEICGQPATCASSDPITHYTCKEHPPEMVTRLLESGERRL